MPTQPLGWFKKADQQPDDFKGMKYRTVGLSADLFREMGASVTILPGGEIVPALDRGLLDAAEFNNPSSDILLGFPDVAKNYMMGSHHQQAECFEIIFNKAKYDALPTEVKAILRNAAYAATARPVRHGAMTATPRTWRRSRRAAWPSSGRRDAVLECAAAAWNRVIDAQKKDPETGAFFKKVVDSQKAWVKRTPAYLQSTTTARAGSRRPTSTSSADDRIRHARTGRRGIRAAAARVHQ